MDSNTILTCNFQCGVFRNRNPPPKERNISGVFWAFKFGSHVAIFFFFFLGAWEDPIEIPFWCSGGVSLSTFSLFFCHDFTNHTSVSISESKNFLFLQNEKTDLRHLGHWFRGFVRAKYRVVLSKTQIVERELRLSLLRFFSFWGWGFGALGDIKRYLYTQCPFLEKVVFSPPGHLISILLLSLSLTFSSWKPSFGFLEGKLGRHGSCFADQRVALSALKPEIQGVQFTARAKAEAFRSKTQNPWWVISTS